MILGLSLSTFTTVHVVISLIGILSGLVVVLGMATGKQSGAWVAVFLLTTALTSATGFLFPLSGLMPSHVLAILSLIVLAVAIVALYLGHLHGAWRWLYVVAAVLALYFNALVGVVQAFGKVPALAALAPTQSEPPFLIAQLIVLAIFIALGVAGLRRFHLAVA